VVVIRGDVSVTRSAPDLAQRLADLANVKYAEYGMTFDASTYAEPLRFRPRRGIA
jgi:hypothetical protein